MDPVGEPAEFPSIDAALTACILRAEADGIALDEALKNLGPASFCFACMLLAMPFLQPIPLGPYTMASGLTFIACGWQMVQGRQVPLLPKGMRNARLHGKGWVAALKLCQRVLRFGRKFTRRRQEARVSGRAGEQLVGWFILCGGALLAIPAANLPFNNIFPALMILCAALAWLERDGLLIVFSLFFGALSVVYFVAVGLLLWFFGTEIFAWIKTLLPGAGT